VSHAKDDLRATNAEMIRRSRRLATVEEEKGKVPPGGHRYRELAHESEALIAAMPALAVAQTELGEQLAAEGETRPLDAPALDRS
jgi:hypothetical protein